MRRAILCALLIACLPAGTASASVLVDPHEIETGPDDSVWVTDDLGIVRVAQDGSMRRILSVGHDRCWPTPSSCMCTCPATTARGGSTAGASPTCASTATRCAGSTA